MWSDIACGVGGLAGSFFEQPAEVTAARTEFSGGLFAPIVARLGGEVTGAEKREPNAYQISLLRKRAVSRARSYENEHAGSAVSDTHLTLPTIYSV